MMASEYKKRGGGYTTDKKDQDESQQHLSKWGEEEWQTKDGSANSKQEDGTQKRYLPKQAWENMTEEEKQATDEKKQEESKEGKQFVGNTKKAKESRQKANDAEDKRYAKKKKQEKAAAEKGEQDEGDEEYEEDESAEDEEYVEEDDDDDEISEGDESADGEEKDDNSPKGKKRGRPAKSNSSSNKKQKNNAGNGKQDGVKQDGTKQNGSKQNGSKQNGTVGSRHDKAEAPAEQGSNDRLPKKGQQVHWKAMPGWVDGEVVEIVTKQKTVEGKQIKASEDDPRLVLKSNSSGKICVHKPDNIYFD